MTIKHVSRLGRPGAGATLRAHILDTITSQKDIGNRESFETSDPTPSDTGPNPFQIVPPAKDLL